MNVKSIYTSKNLVWSWNGKETPLKFLTLSQLSHVKKKLQYCIKHEEFVVNSYSTRLWLKAVKEVMLDKFVNKHMDDLFTKFGTSGKPFLLSTLKNPENYPEEIVAGKKSKRRQLSKWSINAKSLTGKKDNYVKVPGDYIDRAKILRELKQEGLKEVKYSDINPVKTVNITEAKLVIK